MILQSITFTRPAAVLPIDGEDRWRISEAHFETGDVTKIVTYEPAGNVTNDGTYTFTYDAENRIVQVNAVATGALVASYTYDSANRRIKKTVGATTTCSIWEGAQVVAEYNNAAAAGSPNTEYIFTGGRMLAEERTGSGTTRFFHQDRLSTRLTTNSTGAVLGTQSHLPFGEQLTESSEQQKWKFTTYERDSETGDDYAINRGYWPTLGRFRQADPIAGTLSDPQSHNRYPYVLGDPVNLADPVGLDSGDVIQLHGFGVAPGSAATLISNGCVDFYLDGFFIGSTCGGLQPFVDGGDPVPDRGPAKPKQKCGDVAGLAGSDTEVGLLSRLIFAEGTGSADFHKSFPQNSGLDEAQEFLKERYAIASTVYNRVAFLRAPGPTLGIGRRNSTITEVIGSRGAAAQQFAGFSFNRRTGKVDITSGIQARVNRALNSEIGSLECNDLNAAIVTANAFQAGAGVDPFGTGMTFGFRTAGSGDPGSAFPSLGRIIGSGNFFYGPPRR